MKRLLFGLTLVLGVSAASGRAGAQPTYAGPTAREIVVAYNTGPRFSIAPGLIIPASGRVGFSIMGDFRYGIETGPLILAPGARVAGFFPSGSVALTALGTLRLTVPLGPVGPYVMGGAGPGYVTDPSRAGLAYLGGGGLMVHFGLHFALGAEATYFAITGTDVRALLVGPSLLLSF